MVNIPARKACIDVFHNTKVKILPDGTEKATICSRPIFRESDYGPEKPLQLKHAGQEQRTYDTESPSRSDNLKRAREKIFDIAMANSWEHFLTITIAPENLCGVDRNDPQQVGKYIRKWLENQVQRHDLRYLLVPEEHKGGAIHAHAFTSGFTRLVDSGTVLADGLKKPIKRETALKRGISPEKWRVVYNAPSWTLGYSTAIAVYGNPQQAAAYMAKYITKEEQKKIFGNYYLAGGKGLLRELPTRLEDRDYYGIDVPDYSVPQANLGFKYLTIKGEVDNDTASGDQ